MGVAHLSRAWWAVAFALALHANGQDAPLFTAFQQQSESNCASIALIKAMMGTYGVEDVYDRIPSAPGQFEFELKDKSRVSLDQEQLDSAIARTGFKVPVGADQRIRAYADTCYAIMCMKHYQLRRNTSFAAAVDSLCDGYPTKRVGELLGVDLEPIRPHRPKRLEAEQHIIIFNAYHAVYAKDGLYDEAKKSGTARIGRLRWHRAGLKTGFGLRGLSGALRIANAP